MQIKVIIQIGESSGSKYVLNFKHWGGGGATAAPILAYLGEESSLDDDLGGTGWLTDNAR
ncbi:hypothetical protein WN943_018754 [Citrus x changshan-huyou]